MTEDWDRAVEDALKMAGAEGLQLALDKTAKSVAQWNFTDEQIDTLIEHGYEPRAAPRGVSGPPMVFYSHSSQGGYFLRNRICKLNGVLIDGHEGSDLDYGGGCIHCGYDGSTDGGDEW